MVLLVTLEHTHNRACDAEAAACAAFIKSTPPSNYCGGRNASCVVYFLSLSALLSTEQPFWVLERR